MIKDSGERREFSTGAVRDIQEGKGRCDLLPLYTITDVMLGSDDFEEYGDVLRALGRYQVTNNDLWLEMALKEFIRKHYKNWPTCLLELSMHFEEGAKKYGEYNWQKGIPTHCYIDSAIRHYLKYVRGDDDERHDRAFVWNIICCLWTIDNIGEQK